MKLIAKVIPILLLPFCLFSQSLILDVVASSGDYYTNAQNGSLHWTVGQPMCERYENGDVLTQGFHQFFMIVTPTYEVPSDLAHIKVYPNPVSDLLIIDFKKKKPIRAVLYDMYGKAVFDYKMETNSTEMDLSSLPEGTYILSFFEGSQFIKTHKVQRIAY